MRQLQLTGDTRRIVNVSLILALLISALTASGLINASASHAADAHTVTVQKQWYESVAGDTAELFVSSGEATNTNVSTSPGGDYLDTTNTVQLLVDVGSEVTVTETLGVNQGTYEGWLECSDVDLSGAQFTMPEADVLCTYFNGGQGGTVTLTKSWVNAVADDTATLTINGTGETTSTATGGDSTDEQNVAIAEVPAGSTVQLAETLGSDNDSLYTSEFACDHGITVTDGSFTFPADQELVNCFVTNTSTNPIVTLQKQWVNSVQGDRAELRLTEEGGGSASNTSTTSGGDVLDTDNVVHLEVDNGSMVLIQETLSDQNMAEYSRVITCSHGFLEDNILNVTADVTCTITNTNTNTGTATVTLQKQWMNSVAGDTSELKIINGHSLATSVSTTPGGDYLDTENSVELVVSIGTEVILGDAVGGSSTAIYDNFVECIGVTNTGVTFTMPDNDVLCTYTNDGLTKPVSLTKSWVDAAEGDTAVLTINGSDPVTSTARGGDSTDDQHAATAHVPIGATVQLAEVLGSNNHADYTATFSCAGDISLSAGNSFVVPEEPDAIECTVTNTRTPAVHVLAATGNGSTAALGAALTLIPLGGLVLLAHTIRRRSTAH